MNYAIFSDKGKMREKNEDSYLVKSESPSVIAVADGMGGHKAGEIASKVAIQVLDNYNIDGNKDIQEQIEEVIQAANREIMMLSSNNPDYAGMGTTLSMGVFYNQHLYIGHVGDSRIYLFRDESLKQLTSDHTLVNELLSRNEITSNQAMNHPQKHILTQALGTEDKLEIEKKVYQLHKKDILLFCTDGLTDMVNIDKIENLFLNYNDIDELKERLGQKAMDNGGTDNITLIICQVG